MRKLSRWPRLALTSAWAGMVMLGLTLGAGAVGIPAATPAAEATGYTNTVTTTVYKPVTTTVKVYKTITTTVYNTVTKTVTSTVTKTVTATATKVKCNAGIGNGPEGAPDCDPGNSGGNNQAGD
jgi:hypothetical protein